MKVDHKLSLQDP